MAHSRGFTLVELLIAVSILSMLMFTGTFVYSQLSARWDKEISQFDQHISALKGVHILKSQLESVLPSVIDTQGEAQTTPSYFFEGGPRSVLALAGERVFGHGGTEVFRLTAVRNEQGKFDLIYQASDMNGARLMRGDQVVDFEHQLVLLRNLDDVDFSYFGFKDFATQGRVNDELNPSAPQWFDTFSGLSSQTHPWRMRIRVRENGQPWSFHIDWDRKSVRYMANVLERLNDTD